MQYMYVMKQMNIAVKEDTKVMLEELGTVKDSFDDVIKRLIKSHSCCTCEKVSE